MFRSLVQSRGQFRLITLIGVISLLSIPLALYGWHLRRLEAQSVALAAITTKGGTVFYSRDAVYVDFSHKSKPNGMGYLCSHEEIYCPDYLQVPTFNDSDLGILEDVYCLKFVDFTGSQVSKAAAFRFFNAHPASGIGYASASYEHRIR